jgi:hypothetical protein
MLDYQQAAMDEQNLHRKQEKLIEKEEEWKVLTNGNDYMRKRDEEAHRIVREAKEARVRVNRTNEESIRKHLR